jgi:integrase/recombinase XerD
LIVYKPLGIIRNSALCLLCRVRHNRHSCAVHLLLSGKSLTDIKNHLGHENLKSTMIYLHLNVSRKRDAQKKFIKYIQSAISEEPKIDKLLSWENKEEILDWLDDL